MIFDPVLIIKPENVQIDDSARIDSWVKIEGGNGVTIGAHVHISTFCHVNIGGGEVVIGDHAAMASGSKILGGSNTPQGLSMSAASPPEMQRISRTKTVLEEGAFLGANAVVMPGVTIGRNAVIGAGAVVTKDVPAGEIWVGIPAQRAGCRVVNVEGQPA